VDKVSDDDLKAKLNYIGLDLDNIPEFLQTYEPLNFNPSRLNNDKDHRVYKYVPIDKIQIILTKNLRNEDVKKKYSEAVPLCRFLNPQDTPEDLERYTEFLKMLRTVSISEIENIEGLQKQLDNSVPFKVKYEKNHLWQIYYSETTDKYFMLVCTEENTFAEFFYLLKKQIELNKVENSDVPKIFVPINYLNYTEGFLTKSEILDLENYIWLFTKNWCLVFEVFDKKGKMSIQIVGETFVYENVKSSYNIKLKTADEAATFYKLLKALFIMQTEISNKYKFTTKINSRNSLEFYKDDQMMSFDDLTEFIKIEYEKTEHDIQVENEKTTELEERLKKLKSQAKELEEEYVVKQKEISLYLEYKKTFLGKMKYFFKSNKMNSKIKNKASVRSKLDEIYHKEVNVKPMQTYMDEKKYHTLEDLITINTLYEKGQRYAKDLNLDIKAMELKVLNLTKKIENATLYIEEIDKHKRSIWDFWKFANKDEILSLEMGNEEDDAANSNKIKKTFDFESDFENLGIEVDKKQRIKLSKEELDSLFIAKTNMLYILNMIRSGDMNKVALENALEILRKELEKNRLYIGEETFDIFGNLSDEMTKVKYIGNKSHRENERNKIKILNINKKIDIFDFTEKIQSIVNYLNEAINKMQTLYEMPVYKLVPINERVKEECLDIYNINLEKELEEYEENGEGALNLIKLNLKEKMPILYYSNITLYENQNKTLPEGMDLSTNVLLDCNKFSFELLGKSKFRTNNYFLESNNLVSPKTKDIFVYEYEVTLKDGNKNDLKDNEKKEESIEVDDEIEENDEEHEEVKEKTSKKKGFFNKRKKEVEIDLDDDEENDDEIDDSEDSDGFQKKNKEKKEIEINLDDDDFETEEFDEDDIEYYEELDEKEIDLDDDEDLEEDFEEKEVPQEIILDDEEELEIEEVQSEEEVIPEGGREINLDEDDEEAFEIEEDDSEVEEDDEEEELEIEEDDSEVEEDDEEEELEIEEDDSEVEEDDEEEELEIEEDDSEVEEDDEEEELEIEEDDSEVEEDDEEEELEIEEDDSEVEEDDEEEELEIEEDDSEVEEDDEEEELEIEEDDSEVEKDDEDEIKKEVKDQRDLFESKEAEIEDVASFFSRRKKEIEAEEKRLEEEKKKVLEKLFGKPSIEEKNKIEEKEETNLEEKSEKEKIEHVQEEKREIEEKQQEVKEPVAEKLEERIQFDDDEIDFSDDEEFDVDETADDEENTSQYRGAKKPTFFEKLQKRYEEQEKRKTEENEQEDDDIEEKSLEEQEKEDFDKKEPEEKEEEELEIKEDESEENDIEENDEEEDDEEDDEEDESSYTSKKFGIFGTSKLEIVEPEYEEKFVKESDDDMGLDEIFGKKLEITYEEIDLKEYEKSTNTKNGELKEIVIDNAVVERDDDDWDFDEDDEDFITIDDLEKQADTIDDEEEVVVAKPKKTKKVEEVPATPPLRKSKRGRPPKAKVEEPKTPAKRGRKKKSEG